MAGTLTPYRRCPPPSSLLHAIVLPPTHTHAQLEIPTHSLTAQRVINPRQASSRLPPRREQPPQQLHVVNQIFVCHDNPVAVRATQGQRVVVVQPPRLNAKLLLVINLSRALCKLRLCCEENYSEMLSTKFQPPPPACNPTQPEFPQCHDAHARMLETPCWFRRGEKTS